MKRITFLLLSGLMLTTAANAIKPKFTVKGSSALALMPGGSAEFAVDVSLPVKHSIYLKTSVKGLVPTIFSVGKNQGFELAERARPSGYEKDGNTHLDGKGKEASGTFRLAIFETAGRTASSKVYPVAVIVKSQVCNTTTGTCYPPVTIKLPLKVKVIGQKKARLSANAFRSTGVNWVTEFAQAKKAATEKKQNIFVIITAPEWCGYCIVLERDVFAKTGVQTALNSGIVPLRITDKSADLRQFAYKGFPTMYIYSAAGKPVTQFGSRTESSFLAELKPHLKASPAEPVLPDIPLPDHDHIVIEPPADPLPGEADEQYSASETQLLNEQFPVWDLNPGVVNHGGAGGTKKILPTVNIYKEAPGCYVACYSRIDKGAVYSVGGGITVHGQVRVPGRYVNRICKPQGYEDADISALPYFKGVCNTQIKSCAAGDCWAGGDTGGWFGIQE